MKHIQFFLLFLLFKGVTVGQNISEVDTSNYYNYYSEGSTQGTLVTNWLRTQDVVPIILNELENRGYEWLYSYSLFRLKDGKHLVLSVYSRKANFGILYIEGHYGIPKKEHRNIATKKTEITVCEETYTGKANFIKIEDLPDNIFLMYENLYWYQYLKDGQNSPGLIDKEIAIKIFKQDFYKLLDKVPKPEN